MGLFSEEEPKAVELRTGARLKCTVCACERFFDRSAMFRHYLGGVLGPGPDCFVCGQCGYVHWFLGT